MKTKTVWKVIGLLVLLVIAGRVLWNALQPPPASWDHYQPAKPVDPSSFSLLSANVGNADLFCTTYKWKLCFQSVEDRIAQNIQKLSPDVVFLQEVLAPWQCENGDADPAKVCHTPQTVHQARRLVGEPYTILCASRYQFDCIAVKVDAGEILGCEKGEFCLTPDDQETTAPAGCDDGFDIMVARIRLQDGTSFDGVNAHPQSTSASCRSKLLEEVFETDRMLQQGNILVAGDFNFDPFRSNDESVQTFQRIFENGWNNDPFRFHSGTAEASPAPYTYTVLWDRTLDLSFSNFLEGVTYVMGISPGIPALDGGQGMDHKALYGILHIR